MARERVAGVDQRLEPEEGSGGPGGRTREPFANHQKNQFPQAGNQSRYRVRNVR